MSSLKLCSIPRIRRQFNYIVQKEHKIIQTKNTNKKQQNKNNYRYKNVFLYAIINSKTFFYNEKYVY